MADNIAPPASTPADFARAEAIVNSEPVIRTFAALEWDELSEDGRIWVATIVRETLASRAVLS